MTKGAPANYSHFKDTGNHAIDLVAQCAGYYASHNVKLKKIILKPMYYELFKRGTEVLTGKLIKDPNTKLYWQGILIVRGHDLMIDSIKAEQWTNSTLPRLSKN